MDEGFQYVEIYQTKEGSKVVYDTKTFTLIYEGWCREDFEISYQLTPDDYRSELGYFEKIFRNQ